jgi:CRISPR-associated exonuclease Cas4
VINKKFMSFKMDKITGTLIWYYFICKREVWLMAHEINPFEDDPFLEIGRIIHQESYKREKKEVEIEGMKFDLVKKEQSQENVVIAEIKKSSKFLDAVTMQLCFYLFNMENMGIAVEGELLFPKEKKRIEIKLDDERREKLKNAIEEIREIIKKEKPPPAQKIKFCKNCAHKEFCWS